MKSHCSMALGLLLLLVNTSAIADNRASSVPTNAERIQFRSVTPKSRFEFVRHTGDNKPVTVYGDLFMPPNANGPVPAVVISHGSSGVNAAMYDVWAKAFVSWGYAAFVVDSFKPRGVDDAALNDSGVLDPMANVADALNALKTLAADPRIDKTRIVNIGFSRGGGAAIDTYFDMYRHGVITDDLKFAANIPVYPNGCNMKYRSDWANTNHAPMLWILAEKDESTPAAACLDYINTMNKEDGLNIQYKVIKGAYHAFDSGTPWHFVRNGESPRDCNVEIHMTDVPGDGVHGIDLRTGKTISDGNGMVSAWHACRNTSGWSGGGDPGHSATNEAITDVQVFLQNIFAKQPSLP